MSKLEKIFISSRRTKHQGFRLPKSISLPLPVFLFQFHIELLGDNSSILNEIQYCAFPLLANRSARKRKLSPTTATEAAAAAATTISRLEAKVKTVVHHNLDQLK